MSGYSAGDTTKAKMINAAGELAAELGIDNVSTRAVAEASGENIGSIHYHFGGKDGLFEAVAQDVVTGCTEKDFHSVIDELNESSSASDYAKVIRTLVAGEIESLFYSDRPDWHSHVIYQLLQRDDVLYDLFKTNVLVPNMDQMCRLFRYIDPQLSDEEAFLQMMVMKMPIFAHANYSKAMQERMGVDAYSSDYLQKLENLLVKQTLLVLGLPED